MNNEHPQEMDAEDQNKMNYIRSISPSHFSVSQLFFYTFLCHRNILIKPLVSVFSYEIRLIHPCQIPRYAPQ